MNDTPLEPLLKGTRTAAFHFAKAGFEVASGLGALIVGITRTVRPEDDPEGHEDGPQHVVVE